MALNNYFKNFENTQIGTFDDVAINVYKGGTGKEAILLLHGHPESYLMWRDVAPALAQDYTVIVPDLRGYGDSSKPKGLQDHSNYSKKTMAKDMIMVLDKLNIDRFHLSGHDRGARVSHRIITDYPERVKSCTMLDIIPTYDVYRGITTMELAIKMWWWFFFVQPYDLPEKFLNSQPEYMIRSNILRKTVPGYLRENAFPDDVIQDYIRVYSNPATVHAICEDYRAGATIDLVHDEPDRVKKIKVPLNCLWGSDGNLSVYWDVLEVWKNLAGEVRGNKVSGCGHFIPEEKPEIVIAELVKFIKQNT